MVKIEGQIIKIAEQQTGNTNLISSILSPENQKFILEVINGVNRILENRNALMQQPNFPNFDTIKRQSRVSEVMTPHGNY